ncbi:MAG: 7-cyano-7-deazaguanine synthase QueC [Planctomycetes bacterium]|nr:7-cyano-7-deazaguanine synthase QueC [Planctomycetota bacterium]
MRILKKGRGAIGLVSGGLDSTVSLVMARKKGLRIKLGLTFDYGQKAARPEIKSARSICRRLRIPHQVVRLDWLKKAAGNSGVITGAGKGPVLSLRDLKNPKRMAQNARRNWVPNRNGFLINAAAVFAESLDCHYIITGFNQEEARTFPDNSSGFVRAVNSSLGFSTRQKVRVVSPTLRLNKKQIWRIGRKLKAPLGLIWSCYRGGRKPCGRCESCLRRIRAEEG